MMQSGKKDKEYKNAIDCTMKTYKQYGIKGFYRGCLSNAMRSVGSSLVLVFYDEIQKTINNNKMIKYKI